MNDDVTLKLHLDDSEVVKGMSATQKWLKTIEGEHTLRFGGNHKEIAKSLNEMRASLKAIQSQRLTIKAQIDEVKKAEEKLRELRKALKEATNNEARVKVLADIQTAKKELDALTGGRGAKARTIELEAELADVEIDRNVISAAARQAEAELKLTPSIDWGAAFRKGKSVQGAIGTSLETIGNAFSSIGNNPITKALTGALYQVGYSFTNSLSQGLSGAVDRYDTIKTFPKVMQRIGFSADQSTESIEKMKEAVAGMPTGLDDLTSAAQQYALILNDIGKGTDLAIAADTAFLASGATEADKYQGIQQIRDLLSGKQLNSREWNSLIASMPVAIRAIGEELGYSKDEYDKFTGALRSNEIDNKQFIDAMIAVGKLDGELRKLAVESVADKISTSMTVIRQAFTRLGEAAIGALDTQLTNITGEGIVGNLWKVRNAIDNASAEIVKWINENPQKIKAALDKIKNFDYMGFLKSFAKGLYDGFSAIARAVGMLPKVNSNRIGYWLGVMPILGKLITTIGQFVKGTSFIGGLVAVAGKFAKVKGLKGPFGAIGNLISGLRKAKIDELGDMATLAGTKAETAVAGFKVFAVNMGKLAIAVAGVVGAVASVKYVIKSFEEIGSLDFGKVADGFAAFAIGFVGIAGAAAAIGAAAPVLSAAVGPVVEGVIVLETIIGAIAIVTTTVGAIVAVDTWLFKKGAENIKKIAEALHETGDILKNFHWTRQSFEDMQQAIEDMSRLTGSVGLIESLTGKWKSGNLSKIASDFVGFAKSIGKIATTMSNIKPIPENAPEDFKKAVDSFAQLLKLFAPGSDLGNVLDLSVLDDGAIGTKEAGNLKAIMADLDEVFSVLGAFPKKLAELSSDMGKLFANPAGTITPIMTYKENIGKFSEELSTLFDDILKDFNKPIFQNYASKVSEIVGKVGEIFTALGEIEKAITDNAQNLKALFTGGGESPMAVIQSYMGTLASNLRSMVDTMWENFSGILGAFGGSGRAGKISGVVGAIRDTFTALSELIPLMASFQTSMAGLNQSSRDSGGISVSGNVAQLAEQLKTVVDELNQIPESSGIEEKVGAIKTAMENMGGVVTALTQVKTNLEAMGDNTIGQKIRDMIADINSALDGVEVGLVTRVALFKQSLEQLQATIGGFGGAGLNVSFEALKASILSIGAALDTVTAKMQGIGQQWINGIISGLNMGLVTAHIVAAMGMINLWPQGYGAGSAFRSGLITALSGITVTVRAVMDASSAWATLAALRASAAITPRVRAATGGLITNGGVIYRALGGNVFRRRGTDTVPAMLTPGEYVLRKKAVRAYGPEFMQRLNNLDLPGAIAALSTRAANSLTGHRSSVVNNYATHNNNQSVTQNITTNNPNYTFRRANRFVRALT